MLKQITTQEADSGVDPVTGEGLIAVVFARGSEEGAWYQSLLDEAGIPAILGDETIPALKGLGVPVLVAESLHEPASELIASFEAEDSDHDFDDDDDDDDCFPDDPDADADLLDDDFDDD